ncbi:hypothetical protein DFH29DRAFT_1069455 [Suillus ampliporus]|nr:hypothetical protein DFH29DRAFT_1069455 [Suillus ampliporus]
MSSPCIKLQALLGRIFPSSRGIQIMGMVPPSEKFVCPFRDACGRILVLSSYTGSATSATPSKTVSAYLAERILTQRKSITTLPLLMSSQDQDEFSGAKQRPKLPRPHSDPDNLFFQRFPSSWDVPEFCISKWTFKICCFVFTLRGDLQWLYYLLSKGDNWEQMHSQYLTLLGQVSTVQGLVLATVAIFLCSVPPVSDDIDYISRLSYACLAESLVFSLFGLLYQLNAYFAATRYQKRAATKDRADLTATAGHNFQALENFLALFGFGGSNHPFLHISGADDSIGFTGFLSQSKLVQIYLSSTLGFIGACHVASILGSPIYHHVTDLLIHVLKTKSGSGGGSAA